MPPSRQTALGSSLYDRYVCGSHGRLPWSLSIEAVKIIKPQIAIPMHIGRGIGSLDDAEYFKEKASVPVEILAMEK